MRENHRKTIDARIAKEKQAFLEMLEKNPIISVACERTGVSKATYHRWKTEDGTFAEKVHEAMTEGKSLVSDIAKAQLTSLIKDRNFQAIKFWLASMDADFKPTLAIEGDLKIEKKMSPEEAEEMRRTLEIITDMMLPKGLNHNDYDYERSLADLRERGI